MATIAICDGSDMQREIIENAIAEYSKEKGIPISVIPFRTGEELLRNEIHIQYDIYILEILLPGQSGMTVAEELRRRSDRGQIIFLSESSEYGVQSYCVNTHYYMLKPLDRVLFFDVLTTALQKIAVRIKYPFKTEDGIVHVNPREILYVEVENRSPVLHLTRGRVLNGLKLREALQSSLKCLFVYGDFTMFGPSRIVNLEYVERVLKKGVVLTSGDRIEISERAMRAFMEEYQEYMDTRVPHNLSAYGEHD